MATAAPTPAPAAKPSVPAPAVVAPVAPAFDPDSEIAQLKAEIARLQSLSENPPASEDKQAGPAVERIDMSGMVLEKSVDEDGQCTTKVLKQPMINPEMIRATKASQRESGF
jgi:hypothetical protein